MNNSIWGGLRYHAVKNESGNWVIFDCIAGEDMSYGASESWARNMARTMNTTRGWWTDLEGV